MSLSSLMSTWLRRPRRPARLASRRPALSFERLEDRLVPAGALDPTFGAGGIVTTPQAVEARAVAVRADGKIVAVGSNTSDFAVVRYNSDGTLDTSFSGDGIATTDFNKYLDKAFAVAVDGNKTLAVGFAYSTSGTDIALARYNNDGTLDKSFDKDGKVTTSIGKARGFGNYAYAEALGAAIQSDGKIVVVGDSHVTGNPHVLTVVRYNSDGSLDTSFGSGGKAVFANIQAGANKVVILGDGRIVIGRGLGAVRLNANGSLDTTFGNGGIATATVPGAAGSDGHALTVQPDGKIVVVGNSFFDDRTTTFQVTAVRFNADGTLDTSFDGDGIATVNFYNAPTLEANEVGNDVVIDSDGKILIGGHVGTSNYNFLVTRLNTDGSLDTAFGTNGKVETSLGNYGFDTDAYGMALQPDGDVVLAGFAAGQMTLARYDPSAAAAAIASSELSAPNDATTASLNESAPQGDTQVVAFQVTGGGNAPSGLPVVPGLTGPHDASGTGTQLGKYTGDGTFELLSIDPSTGTGTFRGTFTFVAANGDKLVMNYGADPSNPGTISLTPTPDGKVVARFVAVFTPDPSLCTGRFAKVTSGSFTMIATSSPFDPTPNAQGYTVPFTYTWSGNGTLEFAKGGDKE